MRFDHSERRKAAGAERGTVLVEFAFAFFFLASLAMGMLEYGLAYRAQQNTLAGSRTGVRTAASLGKDREADYQALSSLRADLASSDLLDQVVMVVIYRASSADGKPPAGCIDGSASGPCNVFDQSQIENLSLATFGPNGCSSNSDGNGWCPTSRIDLQDSADYVGVYVELQHDFFTKFYGSGLTITQRSVMRLEPTGG